MRIDHQYTKNILDIILKVNHPDFDINHSEIKPLWESSEDSKNKFVFHMEILVDQGLVQSSTPLGVGLLRNGDGSIRLSARPLRLTADGHQFASDLSSPGVFKHLTTTFKDLGPSEFVKATFKLSAKAFENKIETLIGE